MDVGPEARKCQEKVVKVDQTVNTGVSDSRESEILLPPHQFKDPSQIPLPPDPCTSRPQPMKGGRRRAENKRVEVHTIN